MDVSEGLKAAVIGVIEGLTEFIPVSSTGHIVVAQRLLGFDDPGEVFAVVIQLGAILAVCAYYNARLYRLVTGVFTDAKARRFILNVIIASVPAAIVGLALNDWLEENVFPQPRASWVIANTLCLGGFAILAIERRQRTPTCSDALEMPARTALGIGLFQLLALIPGVSRSGASILGAMLIGVERRVATEFSFFLAIPIMVGASGLKLVKHRDHLDGRWGLIAIGFVVSFVVAIAVVHWLIRYVSQRDFSAFGWYRIVAGLLLAGLLALGIV